MRAILLLGIFLVALVSSLETISPSLNYHDNHGIPAAKRIKELEDAHMASQSALFPGGRIVGGAIAPRNMYPYLGGLLLSMTNTLSLSMCGSSLITSNRLLTAAHCWNDGNRQAWKAEVVLGSQFLYSGGTRITTWQTVVHPQWRPSNYENNLAVIYLPTHVTFSPSIQPVALPFGTLQTQRFAGWWANAAGYGVTRDGTTVTNTTQISFVFLQIMTNAACEQLYGSDYIKDSTLCTSGTQNNAAGFGICAGDTGGPLVVPNNGEPVLIGVSSFWASTGCQQGYPSGYTRVQTFRDWIVQHMW